MLLKAAKNSGYLLMTIQMSQTLGDEVLLRGLYSIERAVAQDKTILDRLAVGKVFLEHLSNRQELGILLSAQLLRKLVQDPDLEAYVLSFERLEECSTQ